MKYIVQKHFTQQTLSSQNVIVANHSPSKQYCCQEHLEQSHKSNSIPVNPGGPANGISIPVNPGSPAKGDGVPVNPGSPTKGDGIPVSPGSTAKGSSSQAHA